METSENILEGVLKEFAQLAKIPRKSGHEEAVSAYLRDYFRHMGLAVVQDEVGNIIVEVPAAKGCEKAPLTILQGHMDMVCVAAPGCVFDPLQDAIQLQRDDTYLFADGTSLGSDDGIGVAEAMYIIQNFREHGPLRLIVTVDEEQGMNGAIHLDEKYLSDASYLLNCDSENYDELTVGSAGSIDLDFSRRIRWQPAGAAAAWRIAVHGLAGGHSGERIGDGRGNAIRTLALVLAAMEAQGIPFEIAEIHGGIARNAIPAEACAVLVTAASQEEIENILQDQTRRFMEIYGAVDPGLHMDLQKAAAPEQVFSADDKQALLQLLPLLHTGVYAMSSIIPGMVETSANLGVIDTKDDQVDIQFYPRSAIDQKVDEFRCMALILADLCGFVLHAGTQSPGWKERKDSRLAKIVAETFEQQNGRPMKVASIHAGLECGWHFQKNPHLDMVSIGVTTLDIHSPKERLVLATVAPQVRLIEAALQKIAGLTQA